MSFPSKKYSIIYADPPYDYGNTKNLNGHFWGIAERHYKTMKLDELKALDVESISNDDCYLLMWTTSPFLQKAFEIINSWGFKYSTVAFVWIKSRNDGNGIRTDGLGKYTISNAEYCLVSRKGKYWREAKNVQQVIISPKEKHSKKPDEVRNRIVKLFGNLPRIELFARDKADGWDSWGDEI